MRDLRGTKDLDRATRIEVEVVMVLPVRTVAMTRTRVRSDQVLVVEEATTEDAAVEEANVTHLLQNARC